MVFENNVWGLICLLANTMLIVTFSMKYEL